MLLRVAARPSGYGRRLSDHFADQAASCKDLTQLRDLLGVATHELGFAFFALLDHACLAAAKPGHIRIHDYPDDWVRELEVLAKGRGDPVHLASLKTSGGFGWCELNRLIRLDPRHKRILARSRHYGLGAGFTVPANVPGQLPSSCSFAVRAGQDLPIARLHCAELVATHALLAAQRLRPPGLASVRPRLSRREIQCLRLVAVGKTDWEISRVLGISVETARQYVKSARNAYDVVSRTQLAVVGLRDDWISFDEAIPPSG